MAKNPITVLNEGNKLLDELSQKLIGVDKNLIKISESARNSNLRDYFNAQSPNDVNEKLKLQKTVIEQLNAQVKERNRLEKALNNQIAKNQLAESKLAKELAKQRFETQQRNKQIKESAVLSSKLSSEYQKLVIRMNQAGRSVQNLTAKRSQGIRLSNKEQAELKQSQREFKKYQSSVLKADKSIGRFQRNVGNYGSALGKAGSALRNFSGVFGVFSATLIAREIFELTKEIDGLDKALQQVTETQEGFNQAQAFVKTLANEAGVEINGLQRAYTKFFASAKTTNLTLEQTQNIFRQTAKAGAVLGLSTDDINGSLRALEQILSKGKVQAEEIRGQLGERLPGAFQILAKSMGLTTAELSKQLELGNVLSEEVLPGFADELEKTYGLEAVNKVDTLTAAQNRLSNSWTALVRTFSEDGGVLTQVFKDIVEFLGNAVEGLQLLNTSSQRLNENFANDIQQKFLKEVTDAYKDLGEAANDVAEADFVRYESFVIQTEDEIKRLKERNKVLQDSGLKGRANSDNAKELRENKEQIRELTVDLGKYKGVLEAAENQLGINTKTTKENSDELQNNAKKGIEAIRGSISFLENEIKALENKRQKLATNSLEYKQYTDAINDANSSLIRLKDSLSGVSSELADAGLGEGFSLFTTDSPKGLLQEEFDAYQDNEERKRLEAQKTAQIEKELLFKKLETASEFNNAIGNLGTALYDRKIQEYEDEINKNTDYYAKLLDNEKLTEEQRSALEAERDRKNLILQKKQREQQRKQAIFNKASALAEIALNTAVAVTKVLGQTGIFGLAASVPIIALGALQAATVAATPIPQYKDGKKQGQGKDGIALLNDGGKDELRISKDGSMERIKGRNVLAPVLKSDTIIPDADKFLSNLSDKELYENLHKHTIYASMQGQSDAINSMLVSKSIDRQTEKLIKAFKSNKPKINIHNNNSVGKDISFLMRLNNTL